MENVIVIAALLASVAGTLILLSCLAARRAELVKAFNLEQEKEARKSVRLQDDGEPIAVTTPPQASVVAAAPDK